MKKKSKVGIAEIAEIFSTALALTAQSAQEQQKYKINLSFYSTNLGYITLREICHDKNKSAGLQKLSLKKW